MFAPKLIYLYSIVYNIHHNYGDNIPTNLEPPFFKLVKNAF